MGFYGLDIYSLWDSLARIFGWLGRHSPDDMAAAMRAWQCFTPFHGDPHGYAWNTRLVSDSCEPDVVALLAAVRRSTSGQRGDDAFDILQNAKVALGAERYYRAMVRTDRASWNIRDTHMTDTIDRVDRRSGGASKGVIWEHNTHVGDADILLIGAAGHRGSVIAARSWGSPYQEFAVGRI